MKRFRFKQEKVPNRYLQDCKDLQKFIKDSLNINISIRDTYEFWSKVSDSWDAGWLFIDTHYDDTTREEFLLYQLEKFGIIEED